MNNLSLINRVDLSASVLFDQRAPQLGENPSDHFMFAKNRVSQGGEGTESKELLSLISDIIDDLPEDAKSMLSDWMNIQLTGQPDNLAQEIDQDMLLEAIKNVFDELVSRVDIDKTSNVLQGNALDLNPILSLMAEGLQVSDEQDSDVFIPNLLRDYVEGYTKISKHYGNAREYPPVDVISLVSKEWGQASLNEAALQSIALLGASLSESLTEHYRDISKDVLARTENSMATIMRQDMVLDKNITHTILVRSLESLNSEIQKSRETEFSLKIYPRSLGEVHISVTLNRDQINISIDSTSDASKIIKEDINYFSKQYDNMRWTLNGEMIASGEGSGDKGDATGTQDALESLVSAFNKNSIINIII